MATQAVVVRKNVKSLNGILFADYFPGADAGAKIANAIAALPST